MLYMVIERFKDGNPVPIYQRFRDKGRQMPDGLTYVSSWIREDLGLCYQVMNSPDISLLEQWMAHWSDLMEFEVVPVITSSEAIARVQTSA
jgi:hypothetical protein